MLDEKLKEQSTMLEDIESRESKLSDWERGFIDGVSYRIHGGRLLTGKQSYVFYRIWDRVTS